MDRPAEAIDLGERGLLGVDRLRLPAGKVRSRHRPDLGKEREEALLDLGGVGLVEDLEEARPLAVAVDRCRDEKKIGRIAGHRLAVGAGQLGAGGDQHPFGPRQERLHEVAVHLLGLGRSGQPGRWDAGVADRLTPPPFPDDPHQPCHRPHRLEDPIEEATKEVGLRQIGTPELIDLRHDRADLLAGLIDGAGINGAHRALTGMGLGVAGGGSAGDASQVAFVIRGNSASGSPDRIARIPGSAGTPEADRPESSPFPSFPESGLGRLLVDHATLDIGLEDAEGLLVAGNRHLEGVGEPLGCEKVDDDPLGELDRLWGSPGHLLVETEVDDQFLRGAGHAAEVCVRGDDVGFIDGNLHRLLGGALGGRLGHDWLPGGL